MRVSVATAKRQEIAGELILSGIANAFRKTTIAAETSGRIVTRAVEPGDRVERRQALLTIDRERAELTLQQSQARVKAAEVALSS